MKYLLSKGVFEHYSHCESVNEHYLDKYKKRETLLVKSISDKELLFIKDVLLDLGDSGIKTSVSLVTGHGTRGYPSVYIEVSSYKISDKDSVVNCLDTIKSYMLSNDWTLFYDVNSQKTDVLSGEDYGNWTLIFKREKNI